MDTQGKLLGLAAMQNIDNRSSASQMGSCGLVKWCYSMSHLASLPYLINTTELLVITNDEITSRSLCVPAVAVRLRVLPLDRALEPLINGWAAMLNYSAYIWPRQLSLRALYKLQLFRLTEYHAILFTDVDVDPFLLSAGKPPSFTSSAARDMERAWTVAFKALLESPVRLVASSDIASPINTAVMVLKPNLSIFEEGMEILRRRRFNPQLGFDFVGRPRDALAHLHKTPEWIRIERTRMLQDNDWNFIGGHACQGLFVYLFLVRGDGEPLRYFAYPKSRALRLQQGLGTMRVRHFNSGTKPWRPPVKCSRYLEFMLHADGLPSYLPGAAYCWDLLHQKQTCLQKRLNRAGCAACRKMKYATLCSGKPEMCRGTDVLVL